MCMLISILTVLSISGFQSDSGLSQGGTDSGLYSHSSLSTSRQWFLPQHSPHSYFHVIFISAYPDFMHMSSDNLLLAERKAVCKPATIDITMRRNQHRNNANGSFGKGFTC